MWQLLARDMEEGRIGEHTVEVVRRQVELEEVLLPHLATAVGTRHFGKAFGAIQTDGDVAERGAGLEVTPRPTSEVEDGERRLRFDRLQQRREVLADVVIARPFPEFLGPLIVVLQREVS